MRKKTRQMGKLGLTMQHGGGFGGNADGGVIGEEVGGVLWGVSFEQAEPFWTHRSLLKKLQKKA